MKIKPFHLAALLVIAVGIGVIVSTSGDASTYVTFSEAREMAARGDDDKVHVVGEAPRDASGRVTGMFYNPVEDPDFFRFQLLDANKERREVVYFKPRPADFERSEKIVVVGAMKDGRFVADNILMKCPSKYQETTIRTGEEQAAR